MKKFFTVKEIAEQIKNVTKHNEEAKLREINRIPLPRSPYEVTAKLSSAAPV